MIDSIGLELLLAIGQGITCGLLLGGVGLLVAQAAAMLRGEV
jgi:hypothetical protein